MAAPTLATIQKILEVMIVPEMQAVKDRLASIEGEIKSLRSEIKRVDDKIDNGLARLENKNDSGLARLEERLAGLDDKLTAQVVRHPPFPTEFLGRILDNITVRGYGSIE
jgi:septal ring factor EnvC (AmiA/AmiB activator)